MWLPHIEQLCCCHTYHCDTVAALLLPWTWRLKTALILSSSASTLLASANASSASAEPSQIFYPSMRICRPLSKPKTKLVLRAPASALIEGKLLEWPQRPARQIADYG